MTSRSFVFFIVFSLIAHASCAIDRRKKADDEELSWFFYPLAYTVPGVGSGEGFGGTMVNLLGGGSTMSLIGIRGEMEVDSVALTDIPLFTKHLTLSTAIADARGGGFAFYGRGPNSSEEPDFTLKFDHTIGHGADLTLKFFDRQLEFYTGYVMALPLLDLEESDLGGAITDLENLPPAEQEDSLATFIKNYFMYIDLVSMFVWRNGFYIDYTDDRIDPRVGVRFQFERYGFEGEGLTNFRIDDYSLTAYIPNDDLSSVWVANFFFSMSEVLKPLDIETDEEAVQDCITESEKSDEKGLDGVSSETICRGIMRGIQDFIETEANNSNATSLGGPNRLRSYPISRFHDKYSFFAGLEYRSYFWENSTSFNWLLEKGTFEGMQLALFYEVGQVSPTNDSSLFRDFKYSMGMGLRMVFSAVVLRADYARGEEGTETTVFIGYGF